MNRRHVAGVVVVLTIGLLGVGGLGGAAGATSGRAVSPEDCTALAGLSDNIDNSGSTPTIFGKQAAAVADGFAETAGDVEDKKLRKAMNRLAKVYDNLSGAGNAIEAVRVTATNARQYSKAISVFGRATIDCATQQVTLPTDITLPTGVTLPGGVTIPTLPR